jgi:hypothetical protein
MSEAVVQKRWGDYSSDEDSTSAAEPLDALTKSLPKLQSPRQTSNDTTELWETKEKKLKKKYLSTRHSHQTAIWCPNSNNIPLKRREEIEERDVAYSRRSERIRQLVVADPWKSREAYFKILENEEKVRRHAHIPTVQYVHSILFTLMNQEKCLQSRFEESGITWGPVDPKGDTLVIEDTY